ncbi:MAG: hypothetical protein IPP07_13705 [Holophagales bacterium]|nr:hypothetical protein [Holophagales bacterium]
MPGARYGSVTWKDGSGNLWLFGGRGSSASHTDLLNDLWKFDVGTGQWAWMSGSSDTDQIGTYGSLGTPAPGNVPGARVDSVSWMDGSGNLWLFGGHGRSATTSGQLNDLWRFDPVLGQWSWMSGSDAPDQNGTYGAPGTPAAGNVPGARIRSVSWMDGSGKLWLFGGSGRSETTAGALNDLWRYDPVLGQWSWMSGSNAPDQYGIYGTPGTPAAGNVPGARTSPVSWTDGNGKLWLFGGGGKSAAGEGYLNDLWKYDPALGQWSWMSGSDAVNQYGAYGTPGTPAAGNVPGGRTSPVSWTDGSGKLWLFGGFGHAASTFGDLNDLWRYDPGLGQWSWMSGSDASNQSGTYGTLGIPAAGNVPGGRAYSASWTDGSGSLWLFGGSGYSSTSSPDSLNDLWKFDPGIGQWSWRSGPTAPYRYGRYGSLGTPAPGNVPGGRTESASWMDGRGPPALRGWGFAASNSGELNDLWKYDRGIGQWSWMSGSDAAQQGGTYGTPGMPAPGNVPGARFGSVSWTDGGGNLWLFGGGYTWTWGTLYRNDLWKYDPGIGQWSWMGGSDTFDQTGTYGTLGVPAPGNVPGARHDSVTWRDGSGNLWLFGGDGYSASGAGLLNDLWKYDPGIGQWSWMGGSDSVNQVGTYGTPGTPATGNVPGARSGSVSWTDGNGKLWLFGGNGVSATGWGVRNDLWKYDPGIGQWSWMGGSDSVDQAGVYGTPGTPAAGNIPGARAGSVSWGDGEGKLWLFGGNGFSANGSDLLNDLWRYDPAIGQWAWMAGTDVPDQPGTYGTPGTPAPGNVPGARYNSVSWTDGGGKLWLFGGSGFGSTPAFGALDDLWSYSVCAPIPPPVAGSAARCGAGSLTISASGAGPGQNYKWYDAATGGTLLQTDGSTFTTGPISATTTYYASIYATQTSCESGRTAVTAMVLASPLAPTASNDGPVCEGATLRLSSTVIPGAAYSWTGPNGFTSTEASPTISNVTALAAGLYEVTVAVDGCVPGTGSTTVVVIPRPTAPVIAAPSVVGAASTGHVASVEAHAGATWTWGITNGTITAGQGTSSITWKPAAVGTVTLTVVEKSPAGCDSPEAAATVSVAAAPTQFHVVTPCRLFDTRNASGADAASPALAAGETRTFSIEGRCGIPANAVSLSVNVTVTGQSASGELVAYRADLPSASNVTTIAFPAGRTRANNGLLELAWDGSGTFKVRNSSLGTAHFILDVNGLFR